ncbi:MAG: hypothetical protein DMG39_17265 [Acidobacteria bacterium]|nr:MAG: hypothetical protein DMG39_17265 [Acidobacteriota bacterium]
MNPTILLVDAASAERENWKAFLENQKYDVFTAEHPESARQLCLRLQPDLVLLYDHLPQVRGSELCRRLKQDPLNQLTPVVRSRRRRLLGHARLAGGGARPHPVAFAAQELYR